jgi:hypothetical protein
MIFSEREENKKYTKLIFSFKLIILIAHFQFKNPGMQLTYSLDVSEAEWNEEKNDIVRNQ